MTPLPPELAAAILAEPEANAPRLALADWLDEQGDADWAEFVRVQVALARHDPARTRNEDRRLRDRETALRPLLSVRLGGAGSVTADWRRGLVRSLTWRAAAGDALWGLLPALPALEELFVYSVGGASAADFSRLLGLRLLGSLALRLDRAEPLTWEELEPLANLPRLTVLRLAPVGRDDSLVPFDLWGRLRAERDRRAAPDNPATRLAAVRALGPPVRVSAAGGVWAQAHDPTPADAARRADLMAGLPNLRGLCVIGTGPPFGLDRLAGLDSLVSQQRTDDPPPASLGNLRELFRPLPNDPGPLLAWAAHRPRLRALILSEAMLGRVAVAPPACPALRVLHVPMLDMATGPLPGVVELAALFLVMPTPAAVRAVLPDLRTLCPRRDVSDEMVAAYGEAGIHLAPMADGVTGHPAPSEHWLDWPRVEACPGVSLCVPPWFRRDATPAPDPRLPEVEPLALWREWGDPDGGDDELVYGPVRLRLERVRRRIPATERKAALLEIPTAFPTEHTDTMRDVRPATGCRHFRLRTADWSLRRCLRCLWPGKGEALRLAIDFSGYRVADFEAWLPRVADSLRWEGAP